MDVIEVVSARHAGERGFRPYDFNPSGGLKSVEYSKERFGVQKMHLSSYSWQDNPAYRTDDQVVGCVRSALGRPSLERKALGG